MAATGKCKPLVNTKKNSHSNLTLEGMDFTGWAVDPIATDNHHGEWTAKAANKQADITKELRLVLKCKTVPQDVRDADPPDAGTLTITLTKTGQPDQKPAVPVDYVSDDPLP
jgi:hypothetical protein